MKREEQSVTALVRDGADLIFIRQYREPVGATVIQLPGGGVEEGETLEAACRRELSEETGLTCGRLIYLGSLYAASWLCNEITHVFYSDEVIRQGVQTLMAHEEEIEIIRVPVTESLDAIRDGRIRDSELCCAVLQALLRGLIP